MDRKMKRCQEQVEEFVKSRKVQKGEILKFQGIEDADVYNPSVTFQSNGITVMAGRVQQREGTLSKVVFFSEEDGVWTPIVGAPEFELEDPFVTMIQNEIVLGGVRLVWEGKQLKYWVTDFYRGKDINHLTYVTSGPTHMKDVRLVELKDGRIGVFSRPQGQKMIDKYGCIAKIGFTVVNCLEEVNAVIIENAPFIEGLFLPDEWGGCNQLHSLKNGLIGVIGHKAYGVDSADEKILHYYGMAFVIHPETREMSELKIISSRDCFPEGPARHERLKDVTFTAGIIRNVDNTAVLYTGLSDCQVGRITIPDPFAAYEV